MPRRFSNSDSSHRPHRVRDILRWGISDRVLGRRHRPPAGPGAPRQAVDLELIHGHSDLPRLTWIGHSSFLGSLEGRSFLIDPVFSDHAGVLYRRQVPPGLTAAQLPPLTAVVITHNHYDHLDVDALRALVPGPGLVVPCGLGSWLARRGVEGAHELSWWDSYELEGLRITLVPARHWSRRGVLDTNRTLWGGYVVTAGGRSVYHAGDSAAFPGFAEIGARLPAIDAALLPVGGYEPGWFMERQHLSPEQAGRAFLDVGARTLVPMHWGSFRLSDEPLSEPALRIAEWWRRMGDAVAAKRLALMAVGETLVLK